MRNPRCDHGDYRGSVGSVKHKKKKPPSTVCAVRLFHREGSDRPRSPDPSASLSRAGITRCARAGCAVESAPVCYACERAPFIHRASGRVNKKMHAIEIFLQRH